MKTPRSPLQDTGNPVLDSTVNLVTAFTGGGGTAEMEPARYADLIREVHVAVSRIAGEEPGGLKRRLDEPRPRPQTGDRPAFKPKPKYGGGSGGSYNKDKGGYSGGSSGGGSTGGGYKGNYGGGGGYKKRDEGGE